ncbi:glucosamine-6-phosphate deaminase [Ketogulonicigenium robustum]|uniref:Glucosamine-6-phosphate deaminase n=1 Tax=Ketogulonicigenium robustum TaxID=92947 RepID=A0A1W6NX93_9RHOB|nr:glucosamine-6-phosphate deaminase [Ketogulonicigenium robustum]ARO13862.1 glucosamine-6-phosphate deaminase [Ketogulonicigenium robustum]
MKVLILETTADAEARAAGIIAETVKAKPSAVLGLATGGTMLPLYAALRRMHTDEGLSFAQVTTFNLDEYVGLAPSHPASYHHYMRDVLFDHIDIDLANTHLPRGDAADPIAEADAYEALIASAGGIDLQLLGIGRNGHIGFNEPTSSLSSRTRIKTLTESTHAANRPYFAEGEALPKYALTMGIGSILAARHCVLLATGAAKADVVAAMIEGPLAAVCPASALQLHPCATIVLDRAAASTLNLTSYYHLVHQDGAKSAFE